MKSLLHYFLGLVLALGLFAASQSTAQAFIGISVGIAPPPLPVYVQPACPGDGYAWTPGYWAWDPDADSYYWVPGSWVLAPEIGLLWTPCWWGWQDGAYCFHNGYWGRDVGFYGGINYGHGYNGRGFDGGRWRGNHFVADRTTNTFNGSRVSFNGGRGGTTAVATANERAAANEHHFAATNAQNAEARSAAADPAQRFSSNHGRPAVTSTTRAGSFRGTNANAATGATHQRSNGESAFTGESRNASNSGYLNRASGGNAFTGENRTSSSIRRSTGGESAFTGESRNASASTTAQRERMAQASAAERRTQVASVQRRTTETRTAQVQRTASVERHASSQRVSEPRVSESHFSAPSHTASFHPSVSHSSGGGGGFAHASASHSGGGGFAHASVSHSGGGHSSGGGGGHSGGGGGHH